MDSDEKPLIENLKSDLQNGRLSRREFVRYAVNFVWPYSLAQSTFKKVDIGSSILMI